MLDQLWNKYWVNTLASSPLIATRELATGQVNDVGARCVSAFRAQQLPVSLIHCITQQPCISLSILVVMLRLLICFLFNMFASPILLLPPSHRIRRVRLACVHH